MLHGEGRGLSQQAARAAEPKSIRLQYTYVCKHDRSIRKKYYRKTSKAAKTAYSTVRQKGCLVLVCATFLIYI